MISFRELIDLEPKLDLELMKEPNIEIEEDKPLIEELTDTAYNDGTFGYSWDMKESILKNKINEIITYINKKER